MTVLACTPVSDGEVPIPSTKQWCTICAEEIWVSNGILSRVESGELQPHCMPCALGLMKLDPDEPHVEVLDEQIEEIAESLDLSTDEVRARMRRTFGPNSC